MDPAVANEFRQSVLSVCELLALRDLKIPSQFYPIALNPVPIAGMAYPAKSTRWLALGRLGFRHVICLTAVKPKYSPSPLQIAYAIDLEDQLGRKRPTDPQREERCIRKAVDAALDKIRAREGLVIHCVGGTGRTGTVIGCLLRAVGCKGQDVLGYLDEINKARGHSEGWRESDWQRDLVERFQIDAC
jgi:hypothetical protein